MTWFATFLIMLVFWVFLSGMFDAFHLSLGVLCCAFVAWFSRSLLFFGTPGRDWPKRALRLMAYVPWLYWQVVLASLDIARIVLHPRMAEQIDPQLVRFHTKLRTRLAKVTFAQSITLTPGTITVSMDEDLFTVYALTSQAAASLPGDMEERIAYALEE